VINKFKRKKDESFEDYKARMWKDYQMGIDIIKKHSE
jgi:hypothetical protein